jgi:hypothetical protein
LETYDAGDITEGYGLVVMLHEPGVYPLPSEDEKRVVCTKFDIYVFIIFMTRKTGIRIMNHHVDIKPEVHRSM